MPAATADEMGLKRLNILERFPRGSVPPETIDVLLERCRGHAGNVVSTLQKQGYALLTDLQSRPLSTPQLTKPQSSPPHRAQSVGALM